MFTSCSYRHYLPQVAVSYIDVDPLVMKVGERRKIMSKTFLAVFSPGYMPPPSLYHVVSSNPKVMTISGGQSDEAWVEAKSPGRAEILYQYESGKVTPILVLGRKDSKHE